VRAANARAAGGPLGVARRRLGAGASLGRTRGSLGRRARIMRGLYYKRAAQAAEPAAAAVPAGQRVYAVGDIHGRLDLFAALATAIEDDDAARGGADTTVILLGDLIDRGPHSAEVLAGARAWQQYRKVRILCGNHEEMFLGSFDDVAVLRQFWRAGGRETLLSYPLDAGALHRAELPEALAMMTAAVPEADLAFMRSFEDAIVIGGYLFVHAGIRPGTAVAEQRGADLRWIREPFLSHTGAHGHVVVHGHTITDDVELRPNRIGLDTGAYRSGRLCALALEGTQRWLIEARERDGALAVSSRAL
jgi:serine/threonine protein phosphatase 1